MSAIFGIINRDGSPVEIETLERLRQGTAQWGSDGGGVVRRGSAGLGLALRFDTPEARFDSLPSANAAGFLFTAGGRVDNRVELARELGLDTGSTCRSDGAIMQRAWLRWGETSPQRMFGDWAFAAWDPNTRTLFLARDHAGITVVYYHETTRYFAFSSSRRALLQLNLAPVDMDELYLAGRLVSWISPEGGRTIHRQIRMVPPAHFLKITAARLDVHRYWRPDEPAPLLCRDRRDYVPALLEVFDRAVHDRLRTDSPIASTLSCGLDSGSVTVTAALYLAAIGRRLKAFTSVPSFPTESFTGQHLGDEFPLAAATAEIAGNVDLQAVEAAGVSPIGAIRRVLDISLEPKHGACNMYWLLELHRIAAAAGYTVLLTGNMGNGSVSWAGELSSQPLVTHLRASARRLMPRTLLAARERRRKEQEWREESAIHPAFARRLRLIERYLEDPTIVTRQTGWSRRFSIVEATSTFSGSGEAEIGAATGVEIRDPTADIRVLNFCLSVPDAVFVDPESGVDRWLIREAMKRRLPESVRMNRRRGRQAGDLVPRLRRCADDVEQALVEIEHGPGAEYVGIPAMRTAWMKIRGDDSPQAFKLAVTVLTRGIMAGLFVNQFGQHS